MHGLPSPAQTRRLDISAHAIVLADGNAWGFAQPSLKLTPVVIVENDAFGRKREIIRISTGYGYSVDTQCLLDEMIRALNNDASECHQEAFFALAAALLRGAHSIDLSTAAALLAVNAADLARIAHEIITVALGGAFSLADRFTDGGSNGQT